MQSLKELYKIGRGPSSSHTIGPEKICEYVVSKYGKAEYEVTLYGSLALTGKGHGTDNVIKKVLGDDVKITTDLVTRPSHPNTLDVKVYTDGKLIDTVRGISVGGGSFEIVGKQSDVPKDVYKLSAFDEIREYIKSKGIRLSDYVYETESGIKEYLRSVWEVMKTTVETGLNQTGILQGGLKLERKAKQIYEGKDISGFGWTKEYRLISAYALAVAEENASNGTVVTAPTCGAAGVLPAVMYYAYKDLKVSEEKIIDGLATAGLIGNIVKTNASISGAECGCQAEIGTACSMAAAGISEVYGLTVDQIECASEIAMEHNLGLTCDPVLGLVQVPCIERNTMAASRAINAFCVAYYLWDKKKISFDMIVKTMYETGQDLNSKYLETAKGGMAKNFKE